MCMIIGNCTDYIHYEIGCDFICDTLCTKVLEGAQPPPSGNGWIVEDDNPNLIWEGKTLTIRCGPNQYNPNGENSSTITYSGSEWVQADPHFVCVNGEFSCIIVFLFSDTGHCLFIQLFMKHTR